MKGIILTCMVAVALTITAKAGEKDENKKKLKIIFLMGQSNMVGHANVSTAWYLTRPMYIPPKKAAVNPTRYYDETFFWQGLDYGYGSDEWNAKAKALLEERRASRDRWRALVWSNTKGETNDWKPEYGPMPKLGPKNMYPFLHKKAEEEGIYKRMIEHVRSPENMFSPDVAYEQLIKRDDAIATDIQRVRKIFLNGTQPKDFDAVNEILRDKKKRPKGREGMAELYQKHTNLPIASRTYVSAIGQVSGEKSEYENSAIAHGRLSIGFGKDTANIGPEYAFGITFEQLVDGPILLVKCSWGGTSVMSDWRPPSLANAETPIEKATRAALNKANSEKAKKDGRVFKPSSPVTGTGRCWESAVAHIRKVLADPGKYHPDYDPKEGYELAGLVWFQGWNDMGNLAYGEQLSTLIQDFRKDVWKADLPVVCGLLGHSGWTHTALQGDVNGGMLYAAKNDPVKGSVNIVDTTKYFPMELGFGSTVKNAFQEDSKEFADAQKIIRRASSNFIFHYFGSAKFFLLTGNAMARCLANLAGGGKAKLLEER